jgi:AraC family transcriptional activator FtrA
VGILVSDGTNPFEVCIAAEIFGLPRPELGFVPYEVRFFAPLGRARMRDGLFTLGEVRSLRGLSWADTLIVPNRPDPLAGQPDEVLAAIRAAARRGVRLVALCTGAFTLAEAGVLAGRSVTTHWRWVEAFRARFPDEQVDPRVLFVDHGDLLTSAGSAAALDACLHLVRSDHGAAVAQSISQRLVFWGHRDGGQVQFIERPSPRPPPAPFAQALEWALGRLDEGISIDQLARRAAMAPSTFYRRFAAEFGTTPLDWLNAERAALAAQLLETTELNVDQVAAASGLGTAANLRTQFKRRHGLSPAEHRRVHRRSARQGHPSRDDPSARSSSQRS